MGAALPRDPREGGGSLVTFDTPEAIAVSIEIGGGDVRVAATDRRDTTVEVRPGDAVRSTDVAAARQNLVDFAGGVLLIRTPRRRLWYTLVGPGRDSVDVEVAVPAGSSLRVDAGFGAIRCAGELSECEIRTGGGEIMVEAAGALSVRTGIGNITVERTRGRTEVRTGTGAVRIGAVIGAASIRNSNGSTWVGEISGDLEVRAANGRIAVDRAGASVAAHTACGDIVIGEVGGGAVSAGTSMGRIEVGVRRGIAAWLDLQTRAGKVINELQGGGPPQPGEGTVEVRARTPFGDITVRRA